MAKNIKTLQTLIKALLVKNFHFFQKQKLCVFWKIALINKNIDLLLYLKNGKTALVHAGLTASQDKISSDLQP